MNPTFPFRAFFKGKKGWDEKKKTLSGDGASKTNGPSQAKSASKTKGLPVLPENAREERKNKK